MMLTRRPTGRSVITTKRAVTLATVAALGIGGLIMAAPTMVRPEPQEAPGPPPIDGMSLQPGRFVSGWLPYWNVEEGLAAFTANADMFTDLTTFFHDATGPDGALSDRAQPGQTAGVVAAVKERGIVVLAAVADDTSSGTMAAILADPGRRAAHIAALLPLVDQVGYDGIDIDYESFAFTDGVSSWPGTRPHWVAFITELGAALHERGKFLTVAVPPQFDGGNTGSSGYWVYDWPSIAPHIDVLRVMAYDYSMQQAGPIAPLSWVEKTTTFGLQTLGPQKFRIGVATYGRDWALFDYGSGCDGLSGYVNRKSAELLDIAGSQGADISFDSKDQEAEFSYRQDLPNCRVAREVHFSDARSVAVRAELALANSTGIALWSLGGEDPATWDALRAIPGG